MRFDNFYSKIVEKDEHKRSKEYKKLTPKMKKAVDEIFNKMDSNSSDFINSFEMKEEELNNLQTEILEKEDYKDLDVETFDDQIKSLKETINSDRKIFKEKEYNYLTHGKFVLDGELKKSA